MPANQSTLEVTRAVPAVEKYGPLSILPVSPTSEQRDLIRASDLYKLGDARLAWVNEGDLSCLLFSTLARGGDELREALEKIERWDLPASGKFWHNADGSLSERPMSYEAAYGSNGARDYIRLIARSALASTDMAGAGEGIPAGMKPWGPQCVEYPRRPSDYDGGKVLLADGDTEAGNSLLEDMDDTGGNQWHHRVPGGKGCDIVAYTPKPAAPPVEGLTSGEGEHRLCPWCGSKPILIAPPRFEAHFRAGCGDERCEVKPFAKGVTIARAWEAWDSPLAASPKATATAIVQEDVEERASLAADAYCGAHYDDLAIPQKAAWHHYRQGVLDTSLTDSGTAATIGGERAC